MNCCDLYLFLFVNNNNNNNDISLKTETFIYKQASTDESKQQII